MAYNKTNWSSGDTITAEKLNKIEQGITNSRGLIVAGVFDVNNPERIVGDKTWGEVYEAMRNGIPVLLKSDFPNITCSTAVLDTGKTGNNVFIHCLLNGEIKYSEGNENDYFSVDFE